jgi:hypothetical protein
MGWFMGEVSALRRWQPRQQRAEVDLGAPNATNRFDRRTPGLAPSGFHSRHSRPRMTFLISVTFFRSFHLPASLVGV